MNFNYFNFFEVFLLISGSTWKKLINTCSSFQHLEDSQHTRHQKRTLPSLYNGGWSILLSHILALISRKVSYFDRSCLGWRYEQFERIKDNYEYINGTIYNRKPQNTKTASKYSFEKYLIWLIVLMWKISCSKSSISRGERGKRTYIITASRITSGLVLK